jgi:DNA primase
MIEKTLIEQVVSAVNLPDYIGEIVVLQAAGSGVHEGCCPFHDEKRPSFKVYHDHYHCYGCGAHGNAVNFCMNTLGLSFPEAVKSLANRVGIAIVESRSPRSNLNPTHIEVLRRSCARYQQLLLGDTGKAAMEEIKRRGLDGDTIMRFGIGYAPDAWGTLSNDRSYSSELLQATGLAVPSREGKRVYDLFRNRLMFPVLNGYGDVIGYGGRRLGNDGPKYLNTPETELYQKGSLIFGLVQAEVPIRQSGEIIVCEGFFDVLTPAQHGIENIVSTCGTAVTGTQIELMLSLAAKVILCFDGDAAGATATWRAAEMISQVTEDHHEVRLCQMPEGHDPDSFVRDYGADAFRALLDEAPLLSSYLARELTRCASVPERQVRALNKAYEVATRMAAPMLRLFFTKAIRDALSMTESEFLALAADTAPLPASDATVRACPCCGGHASLSEANLFRIVCTKCGLQIEATDIESVTRQWNRRSRAPRPESRRS